MQSGRRIYRGGRNQRSGGGDKMKRSGGGIEEEEEEGKDGRDSSPLDLGPCQLQNFIFWSC